MQANKFVLTSKPKGLPKVSDFSIEKESLRPLENEGNVSHFTSFAFPQYLVKPKYHNSVFSCYEEILCKALWLTVDPYMRGRIEMMKVGEDMPGEQIAE
jgi:NADPH-dependent curcumin reductase CurA